jgi:hypothetical protein
MSIQGLTRPNPNLSSKNIAKAAISLAESLLKLHEPDTWLSSREPKLTVDF